MRRQLIQQKTNSHFVKVYITNLKNNTFLNINNIQGKTLKYLSLGMLKNKKERKNSSNRQQVIREATKYLKHNNIKQISLYIVGYKKKLFFTTKMLISYLYKNRIKVIRVGNITPIPYNGTKPKKIRRV